MKVLAQLLVVFSLRLLFAELQLTDLLKTDPIFGHFIWNIAKTLCNDTDMNENTTRKMPTNYYGATFLNTDGIHKRCISHVDCYDMREPIFWCRLNKHQNWTDKGCYCDPLLRACIIERLTMLGPISIIRNYAYCTPKASWYCP
ncbi:unnamed protein product [Onchocerca ochengi]|uniref:Phospholipase A(2) n=1 Tax=Onchocerca ochengi TaxID=42157 RepID=A0A182EL90_ONCOC|nr:unnamed protein product [Onchocerca ochengi]